MSAWELVTDDANSYSWKREHDFCFGDERFRESSLSCVPSMIDLLREERWKLEEDKKFHIQVRHEEEPFFRTGSGKPVFFSYSSVAKAISVLGEGDEDDVKSAGKRANEKGNLSASSSSFLFKTGSGNSVNLSAAGLDRAKYLLGVDHRNGEACPPRFQTPVKQVDENNGENVANALPFLTPNGEGFETYSMEEDRTVFQPTDKAIKFHTAGGKSLSVSRDALQRARTLLGDPELDCFLDEKCATNPIDLVAVGDRSIGRKSLSFFTNPGSLKAKFLKNSFISPLKSNRPSFYESSKPERPIVGENLMDKFNEVDENSTSNGTLVHNNIANGVKYSVNRGRALDDISNTVSLTRNSQKLSNNEMKRSARKSFGSSFKKPRSSKFIAPLLQDCPYIRNSIDVRESSIPRRIVSCRFPITIPRVYIKDYLTSLSHNCKLYVDAQAEVDKEGDEILHLETEYLQNMLIQSGALLKYASREWVVNHCKWITWKLASYDKNDHFKFPAKLLTSSNVFEELKYRYEREFNHGHRSAIKRILDGDAPASSMLILCISAIRCSDEHSAKLELSDGWYAVSALLDATLSRHLAKGKLLVGQKLRIWGASLQGWVGPISPLEASDAVTFVLHINGTYRAHWSDRLGFCLNEGHPLAFRCIKCEGGPVPRTLVGVSRIYPLLYKEKLSNGGSIVRTERLEAKLVESHNQRRASLVEGIASEFQKEYDESKMLIDNDSEGAEIYHALERAAEPDILMADMSPEQLSSFASYQSKLEAMKQMDLQKSIEKALKESRLLEREVTPFMRVKVCGLLSSQKKASLNEGLITIWHPTQKQENELVEGKAYVVEGLVPVSSSSTTLFLQAMGLATKWRPLTSRSLQNYKPFFVPRSTISASTMGEVAFGSEFDAIGYVVHVGDARWVNRQKEQWVFVTDESNSILAIRFWWHCLLDDPFAAINFAGSVVGFCNLVKRAKDKTNQFWVADASENSTFYLNFGSSKCAHLQRGAASIENWAKQSGAVLEYLKSQVISAIGVTC